MSVSLQLEKDREGAVEGVVYVHSGTLSGKELPKQTRNHYQTFDVSSLRYQIMDFRSIDRIEMTSNEIKETAKLFCEASKTNRPDHQFAIVISNDPMFAVMKLWETYLEDPNIHGKIFYNMEEARSWIDGTERQALAAKQA